ncbi:MAG: molybdopterin-guanine dinucleotide biosynthesis protein B [Alphaproteobacteria bacterium]|nr:molybdopterin-guanine dinucleotide biosynthesis protein B [Alphaproteobacteria bacterium]MCZ6745394.1 molybdopterin-guanine dinucleotide biosynthesis protein B [Alphaproteobacteria bacterium]
MKVFGLAGWRNSGKTTLMVRLVSLLTGQGLKISTVKHADLSFDIDQPGKDSHRHRTAGATEVVVASARRWALIHELREEPEPDLGELLKHMAEVDLVLIEGFKKLGHDKIEVHRAANGKPLIAPDDPRIVAIASDGPVADAKVPVLALDDAEAIAEFILTHCRIGARE